MFDVETFITDCRAALEDPIPELAVKDLLYRVLSDPSRIEAALGTPRRGGLSTLHQSPELTILNIIWTPGISLYPHDHRMWAVIGLYGGREDNTFYRRAPEGLTVSGGRQLEKGDVTVLGKHVIHAVANPIREFTGAIHVYRGDFFTTPRSEWDPETLNERPWDIERARKVFAEANDRWFGAVAAP